MPNRTFILPVSSSAGGSGGGGAPLNSPAFTGVPTAPTAASGTNTTQLATTAFVLGANGGVNLNTASLTISAAQLKAGFTAGYQIIAAPTGNQIIMPFDCFLSYAYGGTAFATSSAISLTYGAGLSGNTGVPALATINASSFMQQTSSGAGYKSGFSQSYPSGGLNIQDWIQAPLLVGGSANLTLGNGSLTVTVRYILFTANNP